MLRWKRLVNMTFAHIRRHVDAPNFEILFHYKNSTFGIDRVFNFQRSITEPINSSLQRIKTNVEKEFNKKNKKAKKTNIENVLTGTNPIKIEVDFVTENNTATTWAELLASADEHEFKECKLKVFGQEFSVAYNYPYVSQLIMPTVILVGFDCYPAKFEVEFTDRNDCIFEWYKGRPVEENNKSDIEWSKCEPNNFFYRVQPDDLRHKLKVSSYLNFDPFYLK